MLPTPTHMPQLDELASIVAQNTNGDGVFETPIPRLSLVRFSKQTEPLQTVQHPALCIIVQGAKQVMLADEIYIYGPARHLVVSVDLPVSGQIIEASEEKPYLCIRLDLDLPALGAMFMEVARRPPNRRADAPRRSALPRPHRSSSIPPFACCGSCNRRRTSPISRRLPSVN
ncbi:hypothetical protein ABID21_002346 [Pseudorhizobium tarimense]|uniref:Transcription regulator HTH AraC N-terminal domain-containing protein n=1 Tax=Pseudorhizobium tarimense TaxID=1079109 RepID=A0ABV2H6Q5_9HYPH|nr:AraC family transcriptional regulator [Pseudorhizobium tarimense]